MYFNRLSKGVILLVLIFTASVQVQCQYTVQTPDKDTITVNEHGDSIFWKKGELNQRIKYGSKGRVTYGDNIFLLDNSYSALGIEVISPKTLHIGSSPYDLYQVNNAITENSEKTDSGNYVTSHILITDTDWPDTSEFQSKTYLWAPNHFKSVFLYNNTSNEKNLQLIDNNGGHATGYFNYLEMQSNNWSGLSIGKIVVPEFTFTNNTVKGDLSIYSSSVTDLMITCNTLNSFSINTSNIKILHLQGNTFTEENLNDDRVRTYSFVRDTFTESVFLQNFSPSCYRLPQEVIKYPTLCRFRDCYLNCSLYFEGDAFHNIEFTRCTFGPQFSINGVVDTLVFAGNCHIQNEVDLNGLTASNKVIYLLFSSWVDVDKITFTYTNRFQLINTLDQEQAFILLHEKFKREGNTESAKRIDIELKKLQYGTLENLFSKYFWNYGYDKTMPVLVLLGALLFFSLINAVFWEPMNRAYSFGDEGDNTGIRLDEIKTNPGKSIFTRGKYFNVKQPVKSVVNYLWALLYTVIIFFSIRISKDKMHFNGNGPAIISYFVQYAIGLALLVFIAKFVFGV